MDVFTLLIVVMVSQSLQQHPVGQSIQRFKASVVHRSHYEECPGRNLPFSVENKWQVLVMMTLFFGSGFAAPFFLVRHQFLKK
ncbi:cytochrome c oxidase subunit 7C, mitochondrial-like [Choloepus didactylus]|uniref:cytochrome c oxidase subunit 7C, mitochondrial-like n=1 Tax=Choloepus didactylus TaxID=27675 RepID=UPI0018A0A4DF|nr:cytochrome c oxidase subunit 7C, mitochondrial-like [Choloepus didactylus]